MPRITIEVPTGSKKRRGAVWLVKSVDLTKKDGYAFVGEFLNDKQYDLPLNSIIVFKSPQGGGRDTYSSGEAYCLIGDEELQEFVSVANWSREFLDFRDAVAAEIAKLSTPVPGCKPQFMKIAFDGQLVKMLFARKYEGDENAHLVPMSPIDFVKLTGRTLPPDEDKREFDKEEFLMALINGDFPLLECDMDGQVLSSEGLHRGRAAARSGINKIPVAVELINQMLVLSHVRGEITLEEAMQKVEKIPMPLELKQFSETAYKGEK